MQQRYNYVLLGIILLILSVVFHYVHYILFQDWHHLLIFLIGDIAFVPIEVLMVSLVIHHLLTEMEKEEDGKNEHGHRDLFQRSWNQIAHRHIRC